VAPVSRLTTPQQNHRGHLRGFQLKTLCHRPITSNTYQFRHQPHTRPTMKQLRVGYKKPLSERATMPTSLPRLISLQPPRSIRTTPVFVTKIRHPAASPYSTQRASLEPYNIFLRHHRHRSSNRTLPRVRTTPLWPRRRRLDPSHCPIDPRQSPAHKFRHRNHALPEPQSSTISGCRTITYASVLLQN
jgi:hypothetical protein